MESGAAPANLDSPAVGYYGLPVIHGPHWKWLIVGYFYCGGIAGGSAAMGAIARLSGGTHLASLSRTATYVSFAMLLPCPVFLILDLGRPARFHNMLRAFRPSSPMSVGTWALTAFGLFSSLTVLHQLYTDLGRTKGRQYNASDAALARLLALGSGATGLVIASYTGVLLAATAVPIWSKRPMLIAPLFLASAMTSSAAAIAAASEALAPLETEAIERLHRFESLSKSVEAALLLAWLTALGRTAKPLQVDLLGYVVRHVVAGAGIAAPLALSAVTPHLPAKARRPLALLGSALTLVGVFALRYAVVEAGRISADDPTATFDMTG